MATTSRVTPPHPIEANVPPEMLEGVRWICWRDGKIPSSARTRADINAFNRANWLTVSAALKAAQHKSLGGVGFVIGDGFACVDLDHCRDAATGELQPWARSVVELCDSYTEVSPSGTGLHIWLLVEGGDAGGFDGIHTQKMDADGFAKIEVFTAKKWATVTGDTLEGAPRSLALAGRCLSDLRRQFFVEARPAAQRRASTAAGPDSDRDATEDEGQHWLDKALARTGGGQGDNTGLWLAQQLIIAQRNGRPVDVDGTLATYARLATVDPHHPFTSRDVERWMRSAERSDLVKYGEPARSQATRAAGVVTPLRPRRSEPEPMDLEQEDEATPESDTSEDEALLRFAADDNGNAEAMRFLYGSDFLFTPAYGWMRWTGSHWRVVPESIVTRYAIKVLKRRRVAAINAENKAVDRAAICDNRRVNGCVALFKAYVIEPNIEAFDSDPDLLNVKNGVLNLQTGTLTPHDPAQRFSYCVQVAYDAQADMSVWEAFVYEAIGRHAETARYLQTCAGYSLTGHTREEKMFYLYGPTRAGKGTYTESMLTLLPRPLSSEADFNTFTARREADAQNFDLAELKPARVVFASESNRYQSLNPAKIKQITGGNYIRCAFKHRDMFSYRPQFKVWLVSNHPVNADADDDALWGRVQVMVFPHSHLGAEDVTLKHRMKSPEIQRGILRWAVEGAQRWYREDRLTAPDAVIKATREQRDAQDYVQQWLDDCCVLDASAWSASAAILESYRGWCKVNSIEAVRTNALADTLTKRFACTPKRKAGTGARGFAGISVRVTPLPSDDKEMSHPAKLL